MVATLSASEGRRLRSTATVATLFVGLVRQHSSMVERRPTRVPGLNLKFWVHRAVPTGWPASAAQASSRLPVRSPYAEMTRNVCRSSLIEPEFVTRIWSLTVFGPVVTLGAAAAPGAGAVEAPGSVEALPGADSLAIGAPV